MISVPDVGTDNVFLGSCEEKKIEIEIDLRIY